MSSPIQSPTNTRTGLCPHGLPPSACPICNKGAMAGGGSKLKDNSIQRTTTNEWSWMKCYAVGQAMKASEARAEYAKNAIERQLDFAKQLRNDIQQLADKIKMLADNLQNSLPNSLSKIVSIVTNSVILPVIKIIALVPKIIEKFAEFQKFFTSLIQQAGEKLTGILGDLKNFWDRKVLDKIKKSAKKFFLFFMTNIEDENYQNDDNLAIFKSRELRKLLVRILTKKKEHEKNAD